MKCDNCGKDNANVRYLRSINGIREEMNLCEECSKKLGITDMDFSMPIDFSNFLGGFLEDFTNSDLLPMIGKREETKCKGCNSTFEEIMNNGKFGCPVCYETFESQIDEIMNKLHGKNRHVGRIGKADKVKVDNEFSKIKNEKQEENKPTEKDKLAELKEKLKELVREEKYEEAAKVRDEIKEIENK